MKIRWQECLLLAISLAVGFVLLELAHRYLLSRQFPERFVTAGGAAPDLWFFQASPWRFNRDFGYEYVPGTIHGGSSAAGRITSCWTWWTNPDGNIGRIDGDYASADYKVLVFGDSFTAQQEGDLTWPNFLQQEIDRRSGRRSHVINYGRDGYGVLQMIDMAAVKAAEKKPDLVVIAFISDDLTRDRFWRTATIVDGRERILTTLDPQPHPDLALSADTAIMHSGATEEWCKNIQRNGRPAQDAVFETMESVAREAQARSGMRMAFFDAGFSTLADRALKGDAFASLRERARGSQNPRHKLSDFRQDERFAKGMDRLAAMGVPVVLMHLATVQELLDGQEYRSNAQEAVLLQSLIKAVGAAPIETRNNFTPVGDVRQIGRTTVDSHPSLMGMKVYAEAAANGLEARGLIRK